MGEVEDALLLAIRDAVRPHGLTERVKLRIAGGWTARQVFERLSPTAQTALLDTCDRTLNRVDGGQEVQRAAVDRVYRALLGLHETGELTRTKVQYTMTLNTKGPRDMLVDVFR